MNLLRCWSLSKGLKSKVLLISFTRLMLQLKGWVRNSLCHLQVVKRKEMNMMECGPRLLSLINFSTTRLDWTMLSNLRKKSNYRKSIWTCKSRQNKKRKLPRIKWSQFSMNRWPISWMSTTRRSRTFISLNPSSASKTTRIDWMKWVNCKTSVKRSKAKITSSICICLTMLLCKTNCQLKESSKWRMNVAQIFEPYIRKTSLSKNRDRN